MRYQHPAAPSAPSSDTAAPPPPPAPSLSARSPATPRLRISAGKYSVRLSRKDSTSVQDISPGWRAYPHFPSTIHPGTSAPPPRQSQRWPHADHSPHDECPDAAAPTQTANQSARSAALAEQPP